MSLPGCGAIPAPYRERGQMAWHTGKRIVEMVEEDLRPSQIMTKQAFENAIVLCSALGASTNAPPHMNAIARHMGVELTMEDWQRVGFDVPLIVDCQPTGRFLGERFHRAGGVPAVMAELIQGGLIHEDALTVTGRTIGEEMKGAFTFDRDVIRTLDKPLKESAGLLVLGGNLFDAAVMKTSAIGPDFRRRYLENPEHPGMFEGTAIVFEGPEDYHDRLDDPDLPVDADSILFIRNCGPIGYPGSAEVVNMQPPARLIKQGITELPTIGDGRQSGTSASPSILNASPEAALGSGLALLATGDRVRIDLKNRRVDMLVDDAEIERRRAAWKPSIPEHQTPWQEIYRSLVGQLDRGACLEPATLYLQIDKAKGIPRDNH
jgi:dihydroxy-acid dehydratase